MQKLLCLIVIFVMLLSLCACGAADNNTQDTNTTTTTTVSAPDIIDDTDAFFCTMEDYVGVWTKEATDEDPYSIKLVLEADGIGTMGKTLLEWSFDEHQQNISIIFSRSWDVRL